MNKIIKTFSIVVICLFVLATFGWMSVQVSKGEKDFGVFGKPIEFMYSFFDNFEESVEEAQGLPPTFIPTIKDFQAINNLKEDVKVMFSYSNAESKRVVAIKSLRDDKILKEWVLPDEVEDHDRVVNPMLMDNGDLVYGIDTKSGLRRLDSEGNWRWNQDSMRIHHAFNLDSSGNIWTCSSRPSKENHGRYTIEGRGEVYFLDDYITKINASTGEVMFHKSFAGILVDNGIPDYLLHSPIGEDPIHLNDVQPALKTTKYYNEGDLFLSSKSMSIIMHYRPSTNEVINILHGPFSAQHDVDFYNDTTLTWFNNNYYPYGIHIFQEPNKAPKKPENSVDAGYFMSNIIQYDFTSGKMKVKDGELFKEHRIFTMTEGLHEHINDSTYFVEQQNIGYIWVVQNGKVIYKNVYPSQHEGYHHLPNWTRVIKD